MSSNDSRVFSQSSSPSPRRLSKSPGSSSSSHSRGGNKYRKSKTPTRKMSYSPSSSGESSEDDFPQFRSNWKQRSPSNDYSREDLKEIDELLKEARHLLRNLLNEQMFAITLLHLQKDLNRKEKKRKDSLLSSAGQSVRLLIVRSQVRILQ